MCVCFYVCVLRVYVLCMYVCVLHNKVLQCQLNDSVSFGSQFKSMFLPSVSLRLVLECTCTRSAFCIVLDVLVRVCSCLVRSFTVAVSACECLYVWSFVGFHVWRTRSLIVTRSLIFEMQFPLVSTLLLLLQYFGVEYRVSFALH